MSSYLRLARKTKQGTLARAETPSAVQPGARPARAACRTGTPAARSAPCPRIPAYDPAIRVPQRPVAKMSLIPPRRSQPIPPLLGVSISVRIVSLDMRSRPPPSPGTPPGIGEAAHRNVPPLEDSKTAHRRIAAEPDSGSPRRRLKRRHGAGRAWFAAISSPPGGQAQRPGRPKTPGTMVTFDQTTRGLLLLP